MSIIMLSFLFVVGFLGGVVNTLAGGGSFIIYPALIWAGLPPIAANVTNTFACTPGYFSGAYALRDKLTNNPKRLIIIGLVSLVGGGLGALALLSIDNTQFEVLVPWLLLLASCLFIFGERLRRWLSRSASHSGVIKLRWFVIMISLVCFYGGFFNAGFGIILLAAGTLAGLDDIHQNNAFKLYISGMASITVVIIFVLNGQINFVAGFVTLAGTLIGGYMAGLMSKLIPVNLLKYVIALFSLTITVIFFLNVYGL